MKNVKARIAELAVQWLSLESLTGTVSTASVILQAGQFMVLSISPCLFSVIYRCASFPLTNTTEAAAAFKVARSNPAIESCNRCAIGVDAAEVSLTIPHLPTKSTNRGRYFSFFHSVRCGSLLQVVNEVGVSDGLSILLLD